MRPKLFLQYDNYLALKTQFNFKKFSHNSLRNKPLLVHRLAYFLRELDSYRHSSLFFRPRCRLYCQPSNPYQKRESTVSETTTTTVIGPNSTTTFLDKSKNVISEDLNEWNRIREEFQCESRRVTSQQILSSIDWIFHE